MKHIVLFIVILILGASFRLYGVNWDQGHHLHPDERFLTMVANALTWPPTLTGYFDTATSPLNPHNQNFPFFVYGTFPVLLVKFVAETFGLGDYAHLTLVGRVMSALVDIGSMILVYLLTKHLTRSLIPKQPATALFAMLFYACVPLAIQLSHFYAVEPYLTFFSLLAIYLLYRYPLHGALAGIAFGLAIASKITAVLALPVFVCLFVIHSLSLKSKKMTLISMMLFCVATALTVRIALPYLFETGSIFSGLNPHVIRNWQELKALDDPNGYFPPGIQWIHTVAYLFPLENLFLWGLGVPLSLILLGGLLIALSKFKTQLILIPLLIYVAAIFLYQGMQFAKALRYFYPMIPALTVIAGMTLSSLLLKKRWIISLLVFVLMLLPMALMSIYSQPHTRVTASEWIYANIPPNATIALEHWDDPLPLCLESHDCSQYLGDQLPLYDPDTHEKWDAILSTLQQKDYIILTSNRLYGSIPSAPDRYPMTAQYYDALFDGTLGYKRVAEFTSRPSLPFPASLCFVPPFIGYGAIAQPSCTSGGIEFVDDYADETWTVYDHPKVIIFQKVDPAKLNAFTAGLTKQ